MIMFPAFFALVKPASTIANPHCIKKTRAAPIKNQMPNTSSFTIEEIVSILIIFTSFYLAVLPYAK